MSVLIDSDNLSWGELGRIKESGGGNEIGTSLGGLHYNSLGFSDFSVVVLILKIKNFNNIRDELGHLGVQLELFFVFLNQSCIILNDLLNTNRFTFIDSHIVIQHFYSSLDLLIS